MCAVMVSIAISKSPFLFVFSLAFDFETQPTLSMIVVDGASETCLV